MANPLFNYLLFSSFGGRQAWGEAAASGVLASRLPLLHKQCQPWGIFHPPVLGFLSVGQQLQAGNLPLKEFVAARPSFAELSLAVPKNRPGVSPWMCFTCGHCWERLLASGGFDFHQYHQSKKSLQQPPVISAQPTLTFLVHPKPALCSCIKIEQKALPWV